MNTDALMLGDANAHTALWFSEIQPDSRGLKIVDDLDASDFVVLNEHTPTRKTNNTKFRTEREKAFQKLALPKSTNDRHKIFSKINCGAVSRHTSRMH